MVVILALSCPISRLKHVTPGGVPDRSPAASLSICAISLRSGIMTQRDIPNHTRIAIISNTTGASRNSDWRFDNRSINDCRPTPARASLAS
ncbi:hypothetical protein D3C80_1089850 [compost metagenome]